MLALVLVLVLALSDNSIICCYTVMAASSPPFTNISSHNFTFVRAILQYSTTCIKSHWLLEFSLWNKFGCFFYPLLHFWSKLVSRYLYSHVLRRHKWSPLSFSIYSPHRYCQPSHDPTQFGIQMHTCPIHDISQFFSTSKTNHNLSPHKMSNFPSKYTFLQLNIQFSINMNNYSTEMKDFCFQSYISLH